MTPIETAPPDVLSLLEEINAAPSIWYAVIALINAFFLHTNLKGPPEAVCFYLACT